MKDWSDFFFMCAIVSVAVMILFAQVYLLLLYVFPTDNPLCLIITVCGCIAFDSFLLALFTLGNNEK